MEGILMVWLWLAIWLIPAFIAYYREHHNKGAILLVTLLLGWTGIGWIAALVWSATAVKEDLK